MSTTRNEADRTATRRTIPQLLVSVRSGAEATQALVGGADILDAKEPARGSLGMADACAIRDIAQSIRDAGATIPLSAALGELVERAHPAELIQLPTEVTFAKLGLAGLAEQNDWRSLWQQTRKRFDQCREAPLRWVAVAYADFDIARAPSIDDVAAAAVETGCAGLLIDTFAKTGRTLGDFLSASQLRHLAERSHAAGLFLAIAGSLRAGDIRSFGGVNADIIAIRSAACEKHDRTEAISAMRVAQFRDALSQMSGLEDRSLQSLQAGT